VISAISVSHLGCKDVDLLDVGVVGKVADSQSLSSALEKLYFWERKLYGEVRVCMLCLTKISPCCERTLLVSDLELPPPGNEQVKLIDSFYLLPVILFLN
jgi:hypothetical protein